MICTRRILSLLSAVATIASALNVNAPVGWKGNQSNTVTWTTASGDPSVFTIELVSQQFNPLAIANSVPSSLGTLTFELPALAQAGSGFSLEFVGISNITDVFAMSPQFSIQQQNAQSVSVSATGTTPPSTPATGASTTAPGQSPTSAGAAGAPSPPGGGSSSSSAPAPITSNSPSGAISKLAISKSLLGLLTSLAALISSA